MINLFCGITSVCVPLGSQCAASMADYLAL